MPDPHTEDDREADAPLVSEPPTFVREYARPRWVRTSGGWERLWPEEADDEEPNKYHHRP